jgi:hypothetical protein
MDCLFNRRKEKMMKKLFIMILVLGISSAANAVIIQVDGQTGDAFDIGETAVISVVGEDISNWIGYIIVEEGGAGALSDGIATELTGDPVQSGLTPHIEAGWGNGYELTVAGTQSFPVGIGTLFTMNYSGALIDETATISLFIAEDYVNPVSSVAVTVVPEPMTILLLGLGGLFLRRRK